MVTSRIWETIVAAEFEKLLLRIFLSARLEDTLPARLEKNPVVHYCDSVLYVRGT